MAKYTPVETTEWVARNLRNSESVSNVEQLSDQALRISRSIHDPFVAGIVSATCVEADTVKSLVSSKLEVEIIANVPRESYWTGGALKLAKNKNIATGSYSDLLRVVNLPDVRAFKPKEI